MRRTVIRILLASLIGLPIVGATYGDDAAHRGDSRTSAKGRSSSSPLGRFLKGNRENQTPENTEGNQVRQAAEAEGRIKAVESQVQRQIDSIQVRLDREQKQLEARFEQFTKQREAALAKSDDKGIKRIEAAEAATVKEYEKRIQAIVAQSTASPETLSPPVGADRSQGSARRNMMNYEADLRTHHGRQAGGATAATGGEKAKESSKSSRKFKIWPFK